MQIKSTITFAAIVTLTGTMPAYAYLDPGTGTLIVQSLIGGIAAATTLAGVYFARVKAVWNRMLRRDDNEVHNEAR